MVASRLGRWVGRVPGGSIFGSFFGGGQYSDQANDESDRKKQLAVVLGLSRCLRPLTVLRVTTLARLGGRVTNGG